jgi:hypothetical protein
LRYHNGHVLYTFAKSPVNKFYSEMWGGDINILLPFS